MRALEADIKAAGARVFGRRLHDPSIATVLRPTGDDVIPTDGPFAETKDHLGGFYVLSTDYLDGALAGPPRCQPSSGRPSRCCLSWPR